MQTKTSYDFEFVDLDAVAYVPPEVVNVHAGLEDIPHLAKKICSIWGTTELDAFLNHLVMDSRDGARQGLPVAIGEEILLLASINKMIRAIDFAKANSIGIDDALNAVEKGDQERLKRDALDDPGVSRDTVIRAQKPTAPNPRQTNSAPAGSQLSAALELVTMLARSKWVIGAIIFALTVKFLWPWVKGIF
jgi:hypothetical protein